MLSTNRRISAHPGRPEGSLPSILIALPLLLAGCGDSAQATWESARGIEMVDGVEIHWSSGPGAWGADTMRAEPFVEIGEAVGPNPAYLFGAVRAIVVDEADRVFVLDQMAHEVRVFGRDGQHLGTVGRPGDGPGEFNVPHGMALTPDGDLVVADFQGVSRFTARVAGGIPDRYASSLSGPMYPNPRNRPARMRADGTYLYPREINPRDAPSRYLYTGYREGVESGDTIAVPNIPAAPSDYAVFWESDRGGRMIFGVSYPPFHPLPAFDVTPRGTILSGFGDRYLITETAPGGEPIRRIERRGLGAERIAPAERADSLAALTVRLDTLSFPLDRIDGLHDDVRARRLPNEYPAFIGIHAAPDGWIWVERWPGPGASRFDVFDEDGAFLGSVELPLRLNRDVRPAFTRTAIYGVVEDEELGVQRVVGLRLPLD